jgi:phage-related protein
MTDLSILVSAQDRASKILQGINSRIDDMNKKVMNLANKSFSAMSSASSTAFSAVKKSAEIAVVGVTALSGAVMAIGGVSVKAASNMENLEAQLFTTFQGSVDKVEEAKKNITDFAKSTPFSVNDVTRAFVDLNNFGLNPSNRALRAYGDTAAAMQRPLDDMIQAAADAAQGDNDRLKGFGVLARLEEDKVHYTFRGITTTVARNSKAIEEYLIRLGEVNFAGGMERSSKTLTGLISTMKDNINIGLANFAEESGLLQAAKDTVKYISTIAENFDFAELGRKVKVNIGIIKNLLSTLFTGNFEDGKGFAEDHPLIVFFFRVRETVLGIIPFMQEKFAIVQELFGILLTGNFEGGSSLGEDSPLVNFFFILRQNILDTVVIFQNIYNEIILFIDGITPYVEEFVNEYLNTMIERFTWFKDNVLPFVVEEGKKLAEWAKNDLMPAFKEAFETIMPKVKDFNDALMNLVEAVWPVLAPVLAFLLNIFKFLLPPALTLTAKVFAFLLDIVTKFINFFAWSLNDMMWEVEKFKNTVEMMGSVIGSMFSNFPKFIGDAFKGGINLIIRYVNSRIDTFNQLLETARNLPGFGWLPNMWKIQEFARGGIVGDSNMQLVGENGPELVKMPSGSKVTTNPNTEKLLNDGKSQTINLTINVNGGNNTDDDIRKMKDALVRQLLPILKKQL